VFDNGNLHVPAFSRVVEYEIDEDAMTATLVWEHIAPDQRFVPFMGSAQRMDNGNTVISWGPTQPRITEVTPDGDTLVEIYFEDSHFTYRVGHYTP
jgi:hypothetical protein